MNVFMLVHFVQYVQAFDKILVQRQKKKVSKDLLVVYICIWISKRCLASLRLQNAFQVM
jgi:hypothetical protein